MAGISARSKTFGFEPEVTANPPARGTTASWRINDVPISYFGRTSDEGKKIGLKDAFTALDRILRTGRSADRAFWPRGC
jgi:hypothetical protein